MVWYSIVVQWWIGTLGLVWSLLGCGAVMSCKACTVQWCRIAHYGSYFSVWYWEVWYILRGSAVRYELVETLLGLPLTWASSDSNYSTHYCEHTFLWSPSWSNSGEHSQKSGIIWGKFGNVGPPPPHTHMGISSFFGQVVIFFGDFMVL